MTAATEKQISYLSSLLSAFAYNLNVRFGFSDGRNSHVGAMLATIECINIEATDLTKDEAGTLIDLLKSSRASSLIDMIAGADVTPKYAAIVEKIIATMNQGIEIVEEAAESISDTDPLYEVVAEGFEHSVTPYSNVLAMINEYAEAQRKFDDCSPYDVHEETTYQRYAPVKQWLREIWIDDQCIAREVINEQ